MRSALLRAMGWPAALVLLAWLYTQSSQVDTSLHVRTVGHFEQLRQQDARLNQYVLQARFNLLRNYDPLVTTQQRIIELLGALQADKPQYFSVGEMPVQREFMRYRALFESKFSLIEDFKSHNAVLRNSMQYFPMATQGLLADVAKSKLRVDLLHNLLESVLLFDAAPSAERRRHIEQVLQELIQSATGQAQELTMLARHVAIILDYQHEVDQLTKEITQSQSTEEADALFAAYGALYTQRQLVADRYRLALVAVAVMILAYVAWTMAALRRARRNLTGSLRELEFQKYALDAHSIVSITDRSGKITYTNDKFSEVSLYSRQELLGQDHRLLNSGYHPHDFFKTMWATIGHGQVWHGEVKNRRKDGSFYWVDSTIVPFLDDAGKVLRYVSIRTDITERKAAEDQLAKQREFYERVTETLGSGLYVQDVDGRCIYMNSEAERLLGWSREEFLGRPVHDTIHTQTAEGARLPGRDCPIMLAIHDGGAAVLEDQVFVRKDGTVFPVALVSRASTDAKGRLESLVVAFSDITERKQSELAMREAKEAAERAAQVKSDFLANMSHEIRTPMNGIIGMTTLALDTELNAEQREYISLVKSSADALLSIINDILDFSKIESGKMGVEVIDFSLDSMLRDTMKALAMRAHQKQLELLLRVAPDVPDRVRGDPGRLRQVIVNLVGNAIKFTERGEIEVSVVHQPGASSGAARLQFSVRDTGIGIAQEKFDAIFESFSQADTSTTRKYGGTGLGLTISAQLVALMGGQIQLESTLGEGSRFYFTLDLPVQGSGALASYQRTGRIAGLPVLVADDNESNRKLMLEMLRNWRMQPTAVASGAQAMAELERAQAAGKPYPLALLDVQMPTMDGFELAQKIQQSQPDAMPIMMITSQGQRGDAQRCRELGLAAYLTKPVTQSDLLDAIMTTLGEPADAETLITRHSLRENRLLPTQGGLGLRILLAEDNVVNQRLASIVLGKQGHVLEVANNGHQALALWQAQPFDVILMDVDMPEMNGYEATEQIRAVEAEQGGHIPVIAMTAHAMAGARETCLSHGMDGYLSKPIDLDALRLELDGLLPGTGHTEVTPVEQAGRPQLAVADFAQLRQTLGDDHAVFDELVHLYRQDAPGHLQQLQHALAQGDADALRHSAHALKGMLGVFAAERAMAAAQQLEQSVGQDGCAVLMDRLNQCLQEFDQALAQYRFPT